MPRLASPTLTLLSLPALLLACRNDGALTKFDSVPEAAITSPADGTTVQEGSTVTLRGSASDADDPTSDLLTRWFVADLEVCGSAPPDDDGTTTCDMVVPDAGTAGAIIVRLDVTDPDDAIGSAYATLPVTPNASPVITIESPTADGVYYADQLVTFRGTVSDAEDGTDVLEVWWEDDATRLDDVDADPSGSGEVLGYGSLAEGAHALELHALDSDGAEGIATVLIDVGPPNSSPDCSITSPPSGSSGEPGQLVTFTGLVSDPDVPADWLAVEWSSDKDGTLGPSSPDSAGTVTFPTGALSVDTHVITMQVTDELGATCTTDVVYTVGTAPTVVIDLPTDGDVVTEGDLANFQATVSDDEDVASALLVRWESSLNGEFYDGPPDSSGVSQFVSNGLSAGEHAVTVTVTDSSGLYTTALVTLIVNGVPSAPGVSLSPASPLTGDDLVASITSASVDPDGDALTYTYSWFVNGVASAASATDTLPASATTRGEYWEVQARGNDGYTLSDAGSAAVTIINTVPSVASVSITPTTPTTSSTLTCSYSGFADADGDSDATTLSWTVDGTAAGSGDTLTGPFFAGSVATCTATPSDGIEEGSPVSASVTISNTAPVISSLSISPTTAYTNDLLFTDLVATDADGDSLSASYRWFVNGSDVGASGPTLDGAVYFDRDDEVYAEATVDDGSTSDVLNSNIVVVSDTAPTAPIVEITPGDAIQGDDLTCSVTTPASDADGDSLTYTFTWEVDGNPMSGVDSATNSLIDGADVYWSEIWTCDVVASDGSLSSSASDTLAIRDCPLGSTPSCSATDCAEIMDAGDSTGDGTYWLDLGAYWCDMTTDGGGWTQVKDNAPVYGTGWDASYYNTEGFSWTETLFAYDSGSISAHCVYPDAMTGCNDLGFQFASEAWGLPLNWGSSLCSLGTTDYTANTTYPGGYDFAVSRASSSDTIRLGSLEGIASCTTEDNYGTAYVDILVRR